MGKVKSKFRWLAVALSALILFLSVPVEGMSVYADEAQAEEEIIDNDTVIIDETTVSGNIGEDNDEHENAVEEESGPDYEAGSDIDTVSGDNLNAGDDIASGSNGNVLWKIDSNGKLTVNGTGEIKKDTWKLPWYEERESIKSAVINLKDITDISYFFFECKNLQSVDLTNLDTSNVKDMQNMFGRCQSLKELDLTGFDTKNVTRMDAMFQECANLERVLLSPGFNTSKVIQMGAMFYECESLKTLDVSSFDTSNVIGFNSMFLGCKSLEVLDVSNFDTSSASRDGLIAMFSGCEKLSEIDVSNFNTSSVTSLTGMFEDCKSLKNLDLSSFDTTNVTTIGYMFHNCGIDFVDLSNFNLSKVNFAFYMFKDSAIKSIKSPYNVKIDIELPGTGWKREDNGNSITTLPKNLDHSVVLSNKTPVAIKSITFDKNEFSLIKNDVDTINATIDPTNADTYNIIWSSTNDKVATIVGNGTSATITAVGEGTATITAASGKVTATAIVTVSQPVKFDKHEISLVAKPGSQATIKATVSGKNYSMADLEWTSSDPGVATVDKGVVTANADLTETKTATITAKIKGTDYSDSCLVTVNVADMAKAPYATPEGGKVEKGTKVLLNTETIGADIYYTVDGTDPALDASGKTAGTTKLYSDAVIVDKAMTIKAMAVCDGYKNSPVAEFKYEIFQNWGDISAADQKALFAGDASKVPEGIWYLIDGKVYTKDGATDIEKNYNANKITFNDEIRVYHSTRRLWENRDYTIDYKNNTNVASKDAGAKAPLFNI